LQSNAETKRNLELACDIENFKMVAEHYRQDLRMFWTRANFFLLGQTALLSAYVAILPSLISEQIVIAIVISIFGISLSLFWWLVLEESVFWIDQWRKQTVKLSEELDRFKCYAQVENLKVSKKLRRPTELTQYLPLGFVVVWSIMLFWVILRALNLIHI